MLVLCRSPIVALYLLLVTHIAHTFVLLTANVEDVKKIARKFVSDELAEKIADFIARATETFAQQSTKASDENTKDNSQVSAENRMYNIERHGFESLNGDEENSKGENAEKDKAKTSTDKKKQSKSEETDTVDKPKKETKGRSRYIIESEPKETTTEKPASKASEEDNYNQMKDSIKFIEDNLVSATEKSKTKKQKQKKKSKVKPYKLLSNFDSDEDNDVKDETPNSQEKKETNQRSFNDEIVVIRKAALENDNDSNKGVKVPTLVRDEPEYYANVNTKKNEKLGNSGSLVIQNDDGAKWWEKELPVHNQDDANLKKKSWF